MLRFPNIVALAVIALLATAIDTKAQEVVDGGTARHGMHACPVGLYMSGIHVGNNLLLCNNIGSGYQESQEIVDNASADFGIHACPNGMVMTGIHVGNNLGSYRIPGW